MFISCTTLIKEVKLCVDASKHPPLDALLDNLVNHKIAAEEAVKHLQTLVGTTLVQQVLHLSITTRPQTMANSLPLCLVLTSPHTWLPYPRRACL